MKVLIIDDHKMFADGIRALLTEHDANIFTEYAGNVLEAYEKIISEEPPDLILLDINDIATVNSFDLIQWLSKINLDIPVMVISATNSPAIAGLAIENHASGFVAKNCSRKTILEAILSVLAGNMYVSKLKQKTQIEGNVVDIDTDTVTSRQQEVLFLLSQGLLNKQIANELNISANTVKAHLNHLFKRLRVSNRTAAVKYGQKCGLI